MKNHIIYLFSFLILTGCAVQNKDKISGNKEVITTNKDIDEDFSVLDIDDGLEVRLKQGYSTSYVLVADENLVPVIKFEVRGNTLYVRTTKRITGSKQLDIYLTVNSLNGILLKNDAEIESDGQLEFQTLALTGQQSSRFDLDLKTEDLQVNLLDKSGGDLTINSEKATLLMNGRTDLDTKIKVKELTLTLNKKAKMNLKGSAKEAMVNVNGSANLSARRFEVDDAEISMADKADVDIEVSDNLYLYAKDRSNLNLYGSPKLDVKGLGDKASINKR